MSPQTDVQRVFILFASIAVGVISNSVLVGSLVFVLFVISDIIRTWEQG